MLRPSWKKTMSMIFDAGYRRSEIGGQRSTQASRFSRIVTLGFRRRALNVEALPEEDHVDDFRCGVSPLRLQPSREVQRPHFLPVDLRPVVLVIGSDPYQRFAAKGLAPETDAEETVEGWDAAEHSEHRLRHKRVARVYGKRLVNSMAQSHDQLGVGDETSGTEVPDLVRLRGDQLYDGHEVANAPL